MLFIPLRELGIDSTNDLIIKEKEMYKLKLKHHFDACHNLLNYKGACSNLHGHRWVVEIELKTKELKDDMVVDFKELKKAIDEFDHAYLNEKVDFNPTAENLSKYLHTLILKQTGLFPKITIWESPEASITYEN